MLLSPTIMLFDEDTSSIENACLHTHLGTTSMCQIICPYSFCDFPSMTIFHLGTSNNSEWKFFIMVMHVLKLHQAFLLNAVIIITCTNWAPNSFIGGAFAAVCITCN